MKAKSIDPSREESRTEARKGGWVLNAEGGFLMLPTPQWGFCSLQQLHTLKLPKARGSQHTEIIIREPGNVSNYI